MTTVLDFKAEPPAIAYLDPSFLVNLLLSDAKFHNEVKDYSKKLKGRGTILVISNLGVDEIWFALLKAFALRDYGPKKGYRMLQKDPKLIQKYTDDLEKTTTQILALPHLFSVEVTVERALGALELMRKYGLLPRDAFHASAALAAGINTIVTTDADFSRVEELTVYTCNAEAFPGL